MDPVTNEAILQAINALRKVALKSTVSWARARNQGLWSVLRRYGLEPLWPGPMRDGVQAVLRRGFGRWPTVGWFTIPPWARRDFVRRHGMRRLGGDRPRRKYGSPTALSVDLDQIQNSVGHWGQWYFATPRGMRISHPFRDPRLICFCLGLTLGIRSVPSGRKLVLQAAMRGMLPEAARTRREKRGFGDVYGLGMLKSLPELEQMMRKSEIADLGIFRIDELIHSANQAALGVGDVVACKRLDRALSLIAWFDQAVRRRPSGRPADAHQWAARARPALDIGGLAVEPVAHMKSINGNE